MPSFTNNYTEPGTYVAINDDVMTQTNTGLLSVCIIGTGITTKPIRNQSLILCPPTNVITQFVAQETVFKQIVAWVANAAYAEGDCVIHEDAIYTANTDIAADTDSTWNAEHWGTNPTATSSDNILELAEGMNVYTPGNSNLGLYKVTDTTALTVNYYKCLANAVVPKGYTPITGNVQYNVGDFGISDGAYYRCKEANTAPTTITGTYLQKYWVAINYVDEQYWTAEINLQSDINELPETVSGAISTRQYNKVNPSTGQGDFEYGNYDMGTLITISDDITYLKWVSTTLPESDKDVNGQYSLGISYTANKNAADYKPKSFTRLSNVLATYGPVTAENTISTAAQIASDNGATVFYCIQPDPRQDENTGAYVNVDASGNLTETGLQAGLKMAKTIDTYCLVPMIEYGTDSANFAHVGALCKAHVESMSTTLERKERLCILSGLEGTELNDDIDEVVAIYKKDAAAINSPRVIYITPSKVNVLTDNGTVTAPGMFAAAALAGIICNNNFTCGEPISGRTLADVTVEDRYTREEKNQMAAYGCLVLEGAEGTTVPKIRHALSTATGDFIKSEIKITKIKDVISNTLRLALDRAYINTRFVGPETISEMTTTVNTILSSFLANNDIISYRDLVIAQNINYPNEIDVSFRIQPAVDVNYVLITFGVSFSQ